MRPHIEILLSQTLPWTASSLLAGTQEKVLSQDQNTNACTVLLDIPANWSAPASAWSSLTEIFLLRGELVTADHLLREGCYSFLPALAHRGSIYSKHTTLILGTSDALSGEPIACMDTLTMPWQPPAAGSATGLVVKPLRDSQTSQTFLAGAAPFWSEYAAEVHPHASEEGFLIRGDCLLGRQVMSPGAYFFRPPAIAHGPIGTGSGGLWFFRSFGSFSLERTRNEKGAQLLQEYFRSFPLFPPPQ